MGGILRCTEINVAAIVVSSVVSRGRDSSVVSSVAVSSVVVTPIIAHVVESYK